MIFLKRLFPAGLTIFTAMLLFFMPFMSEIVRASVREGIAICQEDIIPSLFPFLFLSSLTISLGHSLLSRLFTPLISPLFNVSSKAVPAVIAGFLGGFPSGAAAAAKLYSEGKIKKEEAQRLPVFTNNAGLMFVLSTLGSGHFSSLKTGLLLYFSHIFASVLAGILTSFGKKQYSCSKEPLALPDLKDFPKAFSRSLKESLITMVLISGNFIIFRVFSALLFSAFGKSLPLVFLSGLIEATGGVLSLPSTGSGLIASAFLLSFNGLSVHMQTLSLFAPAGLSVKKYFWGKALCGFLSAVIMYLILPAPFP